MVSFFKRNKDKSQDVNFEIKTDDCDGEECKKCVIACQNNVLTIENDVANIFNPLSCKSCRICQSICPNNCILPKKSF